MTGTSSSSARSDKSGKNKNLSARRNSLFAQEGIMTVEHEILKENHETLTSDYESLQERIKQVEETYEVMKKHLQSKTGELEATSKRLLEDCVRERSEKEKYKKMFEEMKAIESEKYKKHLQSKTEELEATNKRLLEDCARERSQKEKFKKMFEEVKAMESEKNRAIDELRTDNQELLAAIRKEKEDVERMEKKFVELAERFGVIETECSYLKSLYDAEVAASGIATPVMSGIGETSNHIAQRGSYVAFNNEVIMVDEDHNVDNNATDAIMISDKSDDEYDNPPRESKIIPQLSVDRNRERCKKTIHSSNVISSPSSSSSSSSSSSDGYGDVVKVPVNWAIPKGSRDDSNKS